MQIIKKQQTVFKLQILFFQIMFFFNYFQTFKLKKRYLFFSFFVKNLFQHFLIYFFSISQIFFLNQLLKYIFFFWRKFRVSSLKYN